MPQPSPLLRLTVGSYNIHGGVGGDGVRDIARVGRVVRALDADIVALQEVGGPGPPGTAEDAAAQLSRETGMLAVRGPTMRRGGGDYGNVVLTRLAPQAIRRVDLSWGKQEPRGAIDLGLVVDGARVRAIATHLGLFPGERRAQVERLVQLVRTGAAGDEAATLLMGDINEWFALGRPLRWLHRCFEGRAHGGRTFPARWPLLALDRIWVHPKRALVRHEVFRGPETRVASDHLPVRVYIELPRPPVVSAGGGASRAQALEHRDGQAREHAAQR
jgi:endonuclease/exonuclease/phosphatase family metal-dependent hydrolase